MSDQRLVLFNADDFGLTEGVCRGILEAMTSGVVGTTTAMVCTGGSRDRVSYWQQRVAGRIGIHLQLTDGKPCLGRAEVPSLVTANGEFPRTTAGVVDVALSDVRAEWSAQIDRLRSCGVEPSHMDSHHHVGVKPRVIEVYTELAAATRLPARSTSAEVTERLRLEGATCADLCTTAWYERDPSVKGLLRVIEAGFERLSGRGTLEVMCHPAYADTALAARSTYVWQRERELSVLTSGKLRTGLGALDVEIGSLANLAAPARSV